jgi:hypothetical protein
VTVEVAVALRYREPTYVRGVLYEDDVTDAVCTELERRGWSIIQRLRSTERGDDIVADRDGQRFIIECKGETSTDPRTSRYGKPFDPGQVNSHVSRAMLRAMRVVSEGHLAGVAFPEERRHRAEVDKVRVAIERLGVVVC